MVLIIVGICLTIYGLYAITTEKVWMGNEYTDNVLTTGWVKNIIGAIFLVIGIFFIILGIKDLR